VPLPDAVGGLLQFLQQVTHASDAVLLVRYYQAGQDPAERSVAYDRRGQHLESPLAPFARSIAGSVASMQAPCLLRDLEHGAGGSVELQPFERGRRSLLAAPLPVAANIQAVIELFDKQDNDAEGDFTPDDQRLLQAAAVFGTDLLRQALAQRQTHQLLLDAVAAALGASETVSQSLAGHKADRAEQPPVPAVLDQLREGLRTTGAGAIEPGAGLRLAEAIRVLAVRHGPAAVDHCIRLVEGLQKLLDKYSSLPDDAERDRTRGASR
jgi:two-component system, NtrC family, nitrogen regulation response regulator NtrX